MSLILELILAFWLFILSLALTDMYDFKMTIPFGRLAEGTCHFQFINSLIFIHCRSSVSMHLALAEYIHLCNSKTNMPHCILGKWKCRWMAIVLISFLFPAGLFSFDISVEFQLWKENMLLKCIYLIDMESLKIYP